MTQTRVDVVRFLPHFTDFIYGAIFLSVLASGSEMLSIDSDLGRHLTLGNYILDNRIIPTRDLFSHTLPNQHRPPYEWLSQVLFALANHSLGLDGVILLTAIIIAATFTLAFQFANHRSRSPIISFLITLVAMGASSLHWLPRPHIITFLLLGIWVENLEKLRNGKPIRLFIFPILMLFWANLHGGFIFGILAWLAYMAGWLWEKRQGKAANQIGRQLLIVGSTSLAVTVITPDLWHNWEAVLNNRSSFILSRTVETMPPNLLTASVLPFTFLLALTTIFFLINRKISSASHFFLLTGLGAMSLLMVRNIPLFAITCTPIISELTNTSFTRSKTWEKIKERFAGFDKETRWHIVPLVVTLLVGAYFTNEHFKGQQSIFQFNPQVFPVQAMDWLEAHPQSGNMFNEFNWGGYILYRTWPGQQVFLDSQSDFYGEALMKDYNQIISTRGDWETQLGEYQVYWAIIPADSPLDMEISENQNWDTIYKDRTAIIIRKSQ